MKRTGAGKQRKLLAARVLCGLLLGAYLTGGFGQTAFAAPTGDGHIDDGTRC